MINRARGYIASGEFNGIYASAFANQIIKSYYDLNGLEYVLSRAEYWIDGGTQCQLWAALKEGFKNIVFFSLGVLTAKKIEKSI